MASLSLLRLAPRSSTRVVCSACGARGARIAAVDIAVLGDYPACATPFSPCFFFDIGRIIFVIFDAFCRVHGHIEFVIPRGADISLSIFSPHLAPCLSLASSLLSLTISCRLISLLVR